MNHRKNDVVRYNSERRVTSTDSKLKGKRPIRKTVKRMEYTTFYEGVAV